MPNLINFDTYEQYCSIFGTVWIDVLKKKIYSFLSLLYYFSFSLSLLLFFFFLPPPAPSSCHSLFLFSSSFFSSIFTVASGSFSFFFSCHYLSFFLFLSWRRRQFRSETKLADWSSPIWTSARQGQSPIFAHRHPQLSPPMVGWVWSLIDLLGWGFVEDFEFFFVFWLRFLDLEFVEGSGDCGCSLWRWLLVLGWWWLPLAVHLYICWVLGKYIILIFRIKE